LNPFDQPLPDYEIPIPVKDGYLNIAAALKRYRDEGRTGTSLLLRLPEGPVQLPNKTTDPLWYVNWNLGPTEETQIAYVGAKNGTTEIIGGPLTGGVWNLPSSAIGIWRAVGFSFRDIKGDAFSFGTGPYSTKKNIMVMERLRGRYILGRFIMAACEQSGTPTPNNPTVSTVVNDEVWRSDVDVRYQDGSHLQYIDQRAYVFDRRVTLGAGGNHIYKTAALSHDLEDCVFSNVDPDTGLPHTIGAGVSSVFPNGQTFSGDSAVMSTISLSRIHAKRCKILKVWVEPNADGGAYAVTRQARWDLGRVNPEMVNPTSREYWLEARAAGMDNPENPYLLPFRALWESCIFENRIPANRSGVRYVIGHQSSHPSDVGGSVPVEPHHPDLWFERSRDYMHDCQTPGFAGLYRESFPWTASFPEAEARVAPSSPYRFKAFVVKPVWWPESNSVPPPPPPVEEPEMADITTITPLALATYDECLATQGLPTISGQLAAKDAQIATLQDERDAALAAQGALQAKLANALLLVDEAIAADTLADQQEAARLTAAKNALT
jgi:hypothetical protein